MSDYDKWAESNEDRISGRSSAPTPIKEEPAPDPYEDWAEVRHKRATDAADLVIEKTLTDKYTGDDAAKDVELSDALRDRENRDVAPELVRNMRDDLATHIARGARKEQLRNATKLSGWVSSSPVNAALAELDLANLSFIEGAAASFAKGTDRMVRGGGARITVKEAEDRFDSLRQSQADRNKSLGEIYGEMKTQLETDVKEGQESGEPIKTEMPLTGIERGAVSLSRYLKSRIGAALAGDEDATAGVERARTALDEALAREMEVREDIDKSYGTSAAKARADQMVATVSEQEGFWDQLAAFGKVVAENPSDMTQWLAHTVIESAPSMVAAAAVTAATRDPRAGILTMGATSGSQGSTETYGELLAQSGFDMRDPEQRAEFINSPAVRSRMRDQAFVYGLVIGTMDAASGGLAGTALAKGPMKDFLAQTTTQAVMGSGGELLASLASGKGVNAVDVLVEGLAEAALAPLEVMGVGGRKLGQMRRIEQDRRFFDLLARGADKSELRKKSPKKYREALAAMTKEGPVENLYVNAQELNQAFQNDPDGVSVEQFLSAVPGVDMNEYRAALASNGVVTIPTASYGTDIVGTRFDELLREHLKTDPANMSRAEAAAYEEELVELADLVKRRDAGEELSEDDKALADAQADFTSALRRANRTSTVADNIATSTASVVRTLAKRLNVPVAEVLKRYPMPDVASAVTGETIITEAVRVTPDVVERVRVADESDADALTLREAAEAAGLDVETMTPGELEAAIEQEYGPAAGPSLMRQVARGTDPREPLEQGYYAPRTPTYDRAAIEARAAELAEEMEPLEGAPRVKGASGPDPMLVAVAEAYAEQNGIAYRRQAVFAEVDEERATRIAEAYEEMAHAPDNAMVQNAYKQLIEQTRAQYDALVAAGYEFWFFDPKNDPYEGNPWNAMRDLRANRSMGVYPTDDGYGSGATDVDTNDNPLLVDTGLTWSFGEKGSEDLRPVTANDLFRAVHDALGHGVEGAGFRARGEENAWQAHVRLFKNWAVGALTSETRGQNSWLNYGPHGEKNRDAKVEETVFADQKAGLMPQWTWTTGRAPDAALKVPVEKDGTVRLTHWSDKPREALDPAFAGTGPLRGVERGRRGPKKVFFGVAVERNGGYRKENLGPFRHEVAIPATDLYDLTNDPEGLVDNVPDNVPAFQRTGWVEEQIKERGYKGYVVMDSVHGAAAALFEAVEPVSVRDDRRNEMLQSGAEPDFFSALTREVENAKQKSAKAGDWKAIIAKLPGVKKAEIDWSGVHEWLDTQEGQVPREAVAAFLRENEVQIETVTLSEDGEGGTSGEFDFEVEPYGTVIDEDESYLEERGWKAYGDDIVEDMLGDAAADFAEEQHGAINDMLGDNEEHYDKVYALARQALSDLYEGRSLGDADAGTIEGYVIQNISLPDGFEERARKKATDRARDDYYEDPNYVHTITIETPNDGVIHDSIEVYSYGDTVWNGNSYSDLAEASRAAQDHYAEEYGGTPSSAPKWGEYTERGGENYREILLTVPDLHEEGPNRGEGKYAFSNDSHFDQENILVHARLNYRKDAKGRKVLFVEEVQSDLASAWREKGGMPSAEELRRRRQDPLAQRPYNVLPYTPFEDPAQYMLAMKKVLRIAAEEGADVVAWTPGYMQARRWSGAVQNVVERVAWNSQGLEDPAVRRALMGGDFGDVVPARTVTLHGVNGVDVLTVDADGVILSSNNRNIRQSDVQGKPLATLIGATMARRVVEEDTGHLSGENIVVGGEGFENAYDRHIKKFVEKFAKKYGSKVRIDSAMPDFKTGEPALVDVARAVGFTEALATLDEALAGDETWLRNVTETDRMIEEEREKAATNIAYYTEQIQQHGPSDPSRALQMVEAADAQKKRLEELDDPERRAWTIISRAHRRDAVPKARLLELLGVEPLTSDPVWAVEIGDKMREAASQAQPLFQRRKDGARGSILLPTKESQQPLITLFEKADLSTIPHEMGHYYLHILQDLANGENTSEDVQGLWETTRGWWRSNADAIAEEAGVSPATAMRFIDTGTTGDAEMDQKVNVALHEQWARAYEAYLYEGKSPSNALRAVFEAFNSWLRSVYSSLKKLNVEMSDDIREVFDRLHATDEEIAEASSLNGFDKLVASSAEELGITAEEYETLVRLSAEAQDEARQRLQRDIMAPIRKASTDAYRAERKRVEAEVAAKVHAKPANRAREWMGNERWVGADEDTPNPRRLPVDLRISRDSVIEDYGQEMLDALPRGRRPITTRDSAMRADDVAGLFGYTSGHEMLTDMITTPPAAQEIKSRTDAIMRRTYGDPLGDGTIQEKATRAMHGEKRGQLIAAELRAIGKRISRNRTTTRSSAKEIARRTIRAMPVHKATRSGQYLAAERRAGERAVLAVAKGDFDEAYAAKREQLLNHHLYIESKRADDLVAKAERRVAKLRKKSVREKLAGEYLEAIDDILLAYDFRKSVSQRQARRREGLRRYVDMMVEAGRENELAIPAHVLDESKRRPYKMLSLLELEGVLDSLTNIEHTARMKQKLRDAQSQRELDAVVESIVAEFDANVGDNLPNRVATASEKRRRGVREYANLILNVDTILRKIGGFDRGKAYDAIKEPVDDAANKAVAMREQAAGDIEDLYSVYNRGEQRLMSVRKHHARLGADMTKWDLISAALNMGNMDNMARLMDKDSGQGFNQSQVEYIKAQLDERDWQFVQSVWDYIDTFWPQIAERERRVTGVTPKKVQATEVETPFGTLRGGYYPIRYRGDVTGMVHSEQLADIQTRMLSGRFGKAQTRNGHLEERAQGSGGRVLQLGMEVLHQHVGQVIHDLAFSETVVNTDRIMRDARVRAAFERKGLLKDYQTIELWLRDVAVGQISGGGILSKVALRAKNGFTLSKLAFNISTVMIQFTGIAQSGVMVGWRNLALGYSDFFRDPVGSQALVLENSAFMRERQTTFNKDINDLLDTISVGPSSSRFTSFQDFMAKWGFWLMTKVQFYVVDLPTWYGGYRQGMDKFGDHDKAVKHADRMVARAQASGVFSDRSAIERGTLDENTRQNGYVRLLTTLGSYMYAKANVAYEVVGRTAAEVDGLNMKSLAAVLKGMFDLIMLFTFEAVLYNLIKGTLPGMDEDDKEGWASFLLKETALSMLSTVPGLRDIGSSLSGFDPGAYGSIISTIAAPISQGLQGELDLALLKSTMSAIGLGTGLPSGQLNRVIDAWYRLEDGDDVAPIEFIMGRR